MSRESIRRVAIVLTDDFTMWHFFGGLIRELIARGITVLTITPSGPYVVCLESIGATHIAVQFERFTNPVADLRTMLALAWVLARHRVDLVCNITAKPIIFGSLSARLVGVKRVIGMVEGLGYSFEPSGDRRRRLLRSLVSVLYRLGCRLSDRVGFANSEDRAIFIAEGLLSPEKAVAFRSMIGVNIDEYSTAAVDPDALARVAREIDRRPEQLLVTMVVARQCWSKGVREFAEAAVTVSARFPHARFLLVGPPDPKSPEAVPDEYLNARLGPQFQWITFSHHIREILHLSDVVVLPSYYREGVPRVLLEALAMGKPIVTTDNVGCRETVEDGKNGLLVPVKDVAALADALRVILADSPLRRHFGEYSRTMAVRDFDQRAVIANVLEMWAPCLGAAGP